MGSGAPAALAAARSEADGLRAALAFAASVIKCGEPWTETCERVIGGALSGPGAPDSGKDADCVYREEET